MNDLPRQKLRELIDEYGLSLCDDPRRLEALLKDHCAQHKREIHVLVNAVRERVAADLQRNSAPASILIPQLAERLHDNLGLDKAIARWGVESWAWALNIPATIPSIHGWPAHEVQALQKRTAEALGKSVIFRDRLRIGGEGPEMAVIPAGKFVMGSPPDEPKRAEREGPQREVTFARPFAMGRYAVTFDEYDRYCLAVGVDKPDDPGSGRGRRPVIDVSWHDAQAYCAWLSEQTDKRYRLPSEAEWEYACRAGTATPFSFGENVTPGQVNYREYPYAGGPKGLYRAKTVPVKSLPPNPWGLHEMHGNVSEWCEDLSHKDYLGAPLDGGAWLTNVGEHLLDARRVLRGGSYIAGEPAFVRSAYRSGADATFRSDFVGFRLAQD